MRIIPSPKELGFSSDYALKSTDFSPESTDTWEHYYKKVKQLHPYRYRLFKVFRCVTTFFTQWPRVSNVKYWLRTHTYNRYHILNLGKSEQENPYGYEWGWQESADLLLLANFKILRDFVEQSQPSALLSTSEEDIAYTESQNAKYNECMALYKWWIKERFVEYERFDKEHDIAYFAFKANRSEENEKVWLNAGQARWNRDQEMLLRLINIRSYLYS